MCRKYHFIEDTGQVAKTSKGRLVERKGPTPCETPLGCAKGHWRDEIVLTAQEERVIDAFWASRGAGGVLTDEEKRHPIIRHVFARLAEIVEAKAHGDLIEAITLVGLKR